ncbi:hypothetical protein L596_003942 [Steinernema carpocapsae]|uniref:Uncharacterized protein n=1 Tax=Steinernema carpocapsae TaxID=34508 RepID=A0A4U8UV77_STECR|nr:hypothetical protein L596_003942 [Steinernema carpocapsae]
MLRLQNAQLTKFSELKYRRGCKTDRFAATHANANDGATVNRLLTQSGNSRLKIWWHGRTLLDSSPLFYQRGRARYCAKIYSLNQNSSALRASQREIFILYVDLGATRLAQALSAKVTSVSAYFRNLDQNRSYCLKNLPGALPTTSKTVQSLASRENRRLRLDPRCPKPCT